LTPIGERGSVVATKNSEHDIAAVGREVEDVTVGGDAYIAGFLVEFLRTGDAHRSSLFASAVAHYVIQRTGGVLAKRMPAESDVRDLFSQTIATTSRT
jgi:sugar/nucleoside kinase (ribokinase family)